MFQSRFHYLRRTSWIAKRKRHRHRDVLLQPSRVDFLLLLLLPNFRATCLQLHIHGASLPASHHGTVGLLQVHEALL